MLGRVFTYPAAMQTNIRLASEWEILKVVLIDGSTTPAAGGINQNSSKKRYRMYSNSRQPSHKQTL